MIKATEKHRNAIVAYCEKEPGINLFILADIALYGFHSEIQDVWIDLHPSSSDIHGVMLRYHDTLIVYTRNHLNIEAVLPIIRNYPIGTISGKASVISQLYPHIADHYTAQEMNFAKLKDESRLVNVDVEIQTASFEDAEEIAVVYGEIEEFRHLYADTVKQRQAQIENRIQSGEGKHIFIKKNNKIIAHGNTVAESRLSAMIGGLLTLPVYRNQGYASQIVSSLCKQLLSQRKQIYVFYTDKTKKLFYDLGFNDIEKWTVLGGKYEPITCISK